MALRNNKKENNVSSLAKTTFDKLEKQNRGVRKESISFQEFFKILLSNNN